MHHRKVKPARHPWVPGHAVERGRIDPLASHLVVQAFEPVLPEPQPSPVPVE